jgi:hypothetical protein
MKRTMAEFKIQSAFPTEEEFGTDEWAVRVVIDGELESWYHGQENNLETIG